MKMRSAALVVAGLAVALLCGCGQKNAAVTPPSAPPPSAPAETKQAPEQPSAGGNALGEKIFTTGIGASRKHIDFDKGSAKFKAKPGGCANCHGNDAKGKKAGDHTIPDIRASVLLESQGGKPAMYTPETLKRAVTQGLDEGGKPLEDGMPRWKLSDEEWKALSEYLVSATGTPKDGAKADSKGAPKSEKAPGA